MKFTKANEDFIAHDPSELLDELIVVLGEMGTPQKWHLTTNEGEINVVILDDTLDTSGVAAVIASHGSEANVLLRAQNAKKREIDSHIATQIRKIYPTVNDELSAIRQSRTSSKFLAHKNLADGLVNKGATIKTAIDSLTSVDIDAYDEKAEFDALP